MTRTMARRWRRFRHSEAALWVGLAAIVAAGWLVVVAYIGVRALHP